MTYNLKKKKADKESKKILCERAVKSYLSENSKVFSNVPSSTKSQTVPSMKWLVMVHNSKVLERNLHA